MKSFIELFRDQPDEAFDFIRGSSLLHKWEQNLWTSLNRNFALLSLQDCVVYIKDPASETFKQRYIFGQKAEDGSLMQEFSVKKGQGIVGAVAETGDAEIVSNTANDKRYIVDDTFRYSEMTVPLYFQNKVVGVIDSEHTEKNFFTSRHLASFVNLARDSERFLLERYHELNLYMSGIMKSETDQEELVNYTGPSTNKLMIPSSSGFRIIDPHTIVYLKAEGSYTKIYLEDKTTLLATKNMKEYERKLSVSKFIRVHNSYVINIDHLYGFDKNQEEFHLNNGHRVPISVRRKQAVLERLVH